MPSSEQNLPSSRSNSATSKTLAASPPIARSSAAPVPLPEACDNKGAFQASKVVCKARGAARGKKNNDVSVMCALAMPKYNLVCSMLVVLFRNISIAV